MCPIWANREYLRRYFQWNFSKITDYQLFPYHEVSNAPPVFQFKRKLDPSLFQTMEYKLGRVPMTANFDEFLGATGTTAFIVIKDDTILYENYFNGYTRDSINTSFSAAKSFDSAMIGIAIDAGRIKSMNDSITEYIPELEGRNLEPVTIRHLLTMASGIRYRSARLFGELNVNLPWDDDPKTYFYPDLRKLALTVQRAEGPVGELFYYNNYHPLLLGLILERTTGMSVAQYLQERIWKPLGMEFPASYSTDSKQGDFEKMESGINARAIDFVKFGRLFLNGGNWNGKQIISERWVTESTLYDLDDKRSWRTDPKLKEGGGYYKYMWWGVHRQEGEDAFCAWGHLGQMIFVHPRRKLVIGRFGKQQGKVDNWLETLWDLSQKL